MTDALLLLTIWLIVVAVTLSGMIFALYAMNSTLKRLVSSHRNELEGSDDDN